MYLYEILSVVVNFSVWDRFLTYAVGTKVVRSQQEAVLQ